jgi:hypothetical protein
VSQREEQTDLMNDRANLLTRGRADRAETTEARTYFLDGYVLGHDATSLSDMRLDGVAERKGEPSEPRVTGSEIAGLAAGTDFERDSAECRDADVEQHVRPSAISARAARVDAGLGSVRSSVDGTRVRIDQVGTAHSAHKPHVTHTTHEALGRVVLESQIRLNRHTKAAAARAAQITAEAKEQARQLLAVAEMVAAETTSTGAAVASDFTDPEAKCAGSVPATEEASSHAANLAVVRCIEGAEGLYEMIELFTRTNTELVRDSSALVGAIPEPRQ